jgi:hypothetical protein
MSWIRIWDDSWSLHHNSMRKPGGYRESISADFDRTGRCAADALQTLFGERSVPSMQATPLAGLVGEGEGLLGAQPDSGDDGIALGLVW